VKLMPEEAKYTILFYSEISEAQYNQYREELE
jgi:hypothetical protein